MWCQWLENVIWYPTLLSFLAGTIAYLISPDLAQDRYFFVSAIMTGFWAVTFLNYFGIQTSAKFSAFCSIAGLLLPMTLIIILGIVWCSTADIIHLHFSWEHFLPEFSNTNLWVSITGIVMSLCGIEIATVHARDVKNAQNAFPKALFISTLIIATTLILGSLAIAAVLPAQQISLVAGVMQAFNAFFTAFHMPWFLPLVAIMLAIGVLGSVNNWLIAPIRGLLIAGQEGNLPKHLQKTNSKGAPVSLLFYQAVIVSLLSLCFLLSPSINASYWFFTALASQVYMIMYLLMFFALIYLRIKQPSLRPAYRIPGGWLGLGIISTAGIFSCLVAIIVAFMPPEGMEIRNLFSYDAALVLGLLMVLFCPLIFIALNSVNKQKRK